ncbi:MAG TPA: hypothetical protein PKV16_09120 [Caldisericia bacterium]|nr:hypothetical protein [Caldisericia bacterium]HPF49869.1 hypothetical protein [Caldisericia bacterium]HPI84686.1 hypothetical protein [Caldisericia bacterium]HPQ93921.1 hypothetical protein [Caldisericia bacterium]HRV75720.1 hypothetical protein [Caldisericia bacterium]
MLGEITSESNPDGIPNFFTYRGATQTLTDSDLGLYFNGGFYRPDLGVSLGSKKIILNPTSYGPFGLLSKLNKSSRQLSIQGALAATNGPSNDDGLAAPGIGETQPIDDTDEKSDDGIKPLPPADIEVELILVKSGGGKEVELKVDPRLEEILKYFGDHQMPRYRSCPCYVGINGQTLTCEQIGMIAAAEGRGDVCEAIARRASLYEQLKIEEEKEPPDEKEIERIKAEIAECDRIINDFAGTIEAAAFSTNENGDMALMSYKIIGQEPRAFMPPSDGNGVGEPVTRSTTGEQWKKAWDKHSKNGSRSGYNISGFKMEMIFSTDCENGSIFVYINADGSIEMIGCCGNSIADENSGDSSTTSIVRYVDEGWDEDGDYYYNTDRTVYFREDGTTYVLTVFEPGYVIQGGVKLDTQSILNSRNKHLIEMFSKWGTVR